ncbi:MAG: hypothetical protein ACLVLH_20990, partial [Eisenbergiella massiliensis]
DISHVSHDCKRIERGHGGTDAGIACNAAAARGSELLQLVRFMAFLLLSFGRHSKWAGLTEYY